MSTIKLEIDGNKATQVAAATAFFHVLNGGVFGSVELTTEKEPGVNTPVVNTPVVNPPVVNTPVVNTPVVNTPVVNTPGVKGPTLEEVRTVLGSKTIENRALVPTLKARLTELGANNVSTLDAKHYPVFLEFLNGLA